MSAQQSNQVSQRFTIEYYDPRDDYSLVSEIRGRRLKGLSMEESVEETAGFYGINNYSWREVEY